MCMAQTVVDGASKEATVLVRGDGSRLPQLLERLLDSPHLPSLPESRKKSQRWTPLFRSSVVLPGS